MMPLRPFLAAILLATVVGGPAARPAAGQTPTLAARAASAEALRARGTAEAIRQAAAAFEQLVNDAEKAGDQAVVVDALIGFGRSVDAGGDGRRAVALFQRAVDLTEARGDNENEAWALNYGALTYDRLGERPTALAWLTRARPLAHAVPTSRVEAITLNNFGVIYYNTGDRAQALEYYTQALEKHTALGNARGEATTLSNIGTLYDALGQKDKALDYLLRALPLRMSLGEPRDSATTLNNVGAVYYSIDNFAQALDYYTRALVEWRRAGDRSGEAATLHNIANVHEVTGDFQTALDFYRQALPLQRAVGYRIGEANTLTNIGRLYATLGEPQQALDYDEQALPIHRAVGNRSTEAATLTNIGAAYAALGDAHKALGFHEQALPIRRAVGDRAGEAATLVDIGRLQASLGHREDARGFYTAALTLSTAVGSPRGEAVAIMNLGVLSASMGDDAGAIAFFNRAAPIFDAAGDRASSAFVLYSRASSERALGRLDTALADIDSAVAIVESLRTKVANPDLRSSYFASVRAYYELAIDLRMRLDREHPGRGYDAQALQTSERAHARALLDLLEESHGDIREGVEPALLARERAARQLLNARAARQARALSGQTPAPDPAVLARQLAAAEGELDEAQAAIRQHSPRYAALTQPSPLTLAQVQSQLDADTLLLEYAEGDDASYLWVVASSGAASYQLAPRAQIESAARTFYDHLRNPDAPAAARRASGEALSALVLGPVATRLAHHRLVIVADGALQYIPFGALPAPARSDAAPLVADHEIVSLASVSALAVLRDGVAARSRAPKALAILADPVFAADDTRVLATTVPTATTVTGATGAGRRSADDGWDSDFHLSRLIGSRREAAALMQLVPARERTQTFGFDANRQAATSAELSQYRIVHFATHGLLNTRHPELSGIVLSLVDRHGASVDGFLRLYDIFNLHLPADLVVLSACQTALGREVRGEGLVGLTSGFMYAGAARVVASSWKVDDQATAELMRRFYAAMFGAGHLAPAAALRQAQLSLLRERAWSSPYYWAAFTLQGEWR
jgi:CHAT domain-containing protein/Tfp pilus assembly protein PilF